MLFNATIRVLIEANSLDAADQIAFNMLCEVNEVGSRRFSGSYELAEAEKPLDDESA